MEKRVEVSGIRKSKGKYCIEKEDASNDKVQLVSEKKKW